MAVTQLVWVVIGILTGTVGVDFVLCRWAPDGVGVMCRVIGVQPGPGG